MTRLIGTVSLMVISAPLLVTADVWADIMTHCPTSNSAAASVATECMETSLRPIQTCGTGHNTAEMKCICSVYVSAEQCWSNWCDSVGMAAWTSIWGGCAQSGVFPSSSDASATTGVKTGPTPSTTPLATLTGTGSGSGAGTGPATGAGTGGGGGPAPSSTKSSGGAGSVPQAAIYGGLLGAGFVAALAL
ncbi:hypothetical protein B0H63DRAFT_489477 [Podospora didyma]|uniref:Extracellular membrane protein CFEM domain-containing protein n=1 Tax=Podospora didyma TaxID=330526 RepID=A0AAE0K056_9PEZI|nr:hypothetical protein B0H63DRAFT_489477 [Podospora didyma]